ncbi:MAG TPA: long-chain-acyl-CoA synthetase [Caulobacteraceae bacterium]|jgi:fatty-acyl-CoA synthase
MEAIEREGRYLTGLIRTLLRVRSIAPTSTNLITDDLERAIDRWPDRLAIRFEGAELTYRKLDALANRYAAWAEGEGLGKGDRVAVLLPNRLEYLPLWFGLSKLGVVAALINYQLTGEALSHCLELSGARICVADASTRAAFDAVAVASLQARDLDADLHGAASTAGDSRPQRSARAGVTAGETALLIYTSGTTGLPKAARINHARAQLYMRGFAGSTGARPSDRIYVTLPLYHATGGLCAMGAALLNGASVILRHSFSAGHFWDEIRDEGATMFVYIGELCRYLVNRPVGASEKNHQIRLAFGNGLSRDIWPELLRRFAVPRVLEFYGSTEGNVSMFNFDGGEGAIGRIPDYLAPLFNVVLARFDVEAESPVRGAGGFCIRCAPDEPGECLGAIHGDARSAYSGYVDHAASEKKVLRNAFRTGDAWFRTGDLLRRDRLGYFYFVDRVGDTFRWKGENVSTTEVTEVIAAAPGVLQATVYGVAVPHNEGRAGMASVVTGPDFSLPVLSAVLEHSLPAYARPLFLRLSNSLAVTGTFKPRKMDLLAAGFDPSKCGDPLYFHDHDAGFTPLTDKLNARIMAGEVRI